MILADTSGWLALGDQAQPEHAAAAQVYRERLQKKQRFLTTNYILAETVALMTIRSRLPRAQVLAFAQTIKTAPHVEVVHVDEALDTAGWALLQSRLDKSWTLVDAVSFILMQQRGLTEAFTTDHHFEQAGFVRLLKPGLWTFT
jgi:predicted nucleic acid-binding protein